MSIQSVWFPAVLALLAFSCDDAAGPPDDISGACERQRECAAENGEGASSYDREQCPDRLSAEYDQASSYGCGAAYADWVSCQATQRGHCPLPIVMDESSGGDAANAGADESMDPCQSARDALELCQSEAERGGLSQ